MDEAFEHEDSKGQQVQTGQFRPIEPYVRVDAYFGMRDELRALFNREIDLVMAGAVKNRQDFRFMQFQ